MPYVCTMLHPFPSICTQILLSQYHKKGLCHYYIIFTEAFASVLWYSVRNREVMSNMSERISGSRTGQRWGSVKELMYFKTRKKKEVINQNSLESLLQLQTNNGYLLSLRIRDTPSCIITTIHAINTGAKCLALGLRETEWKKAVSG